MANSTIKFSRIFPILVFSVLASCESTSPQMCQNYIDDKRFEQALDACESNYQLTGDQNVLVLAAEAAGELSDFDKMERFVALLKGTTYSAKILSYMGSYASADGKNIKVARDYFKRSEKLYRELKDNNKLSDVLLKQANIEWRKSNHREALKLARESLEFASGDTNREVKALNRMFAIFRGTGSTETAKHVLKIISEKIGKGKTGNHINTLIAYGLLEKQQNRHGLAEFKFQEALVAAGNSKNRSAMRGLHLNLVDSNLALNRIDIAKHHLDMAWEFAELDGSIRFALFYYHAKYLLKINQPLAAYDKLHEALNCPDVTNSWIWELHYWKGRAAELFNDLEKAESSFRISVDELEKRKNEIGYRNLKSHIIDKKRQPYESLFNLLVKKNKIYAAIDIFEKTLSQGFIESFVKSSRNKITADGTEFPIAQVSDRQDMLLNYIKGMQLSPIITFDETRKNLPKIENAEIISFFIAQDKTWIIRISKGKPSFRLVDLSIEKLKKLVLSHHIDPDNIDTLTALGSALFPKDLLPVTHTNLYIIPEFKLGEIGFASLRINQKFLIDRYVLAVIPSINALISLQENAKNSAKTSQDTIVLGDPNSNLPEANGEAVFVAKQMNGKVLLGSDANLINLQKIDQARVIHFATHSGFNHMGSWLSLADKDIYANTILNLRLSPELVGLASCSSGSRGKNNLWGSLGGLFLTAGAQSVLASLWPVEDKSTRLLIENFYKAYSNNLSAAKALAHAQRLAVRQGLKPRHWSGFIIMGLATNNDLLIANN